MKKLKNFLVCAKLLKVCGEVVKVEQFVKLPCIDEEDLFGILRTFERCAEFEVQAVFGVKVFNCDEETPTWIDVGSRFVTAEFNGFLNEMRK